MGMRKGDLGLTVIDDLPEMIGWMKGEKGLFDFFESHLLVFWKVYLFSVFIYFRNGR